MMVSLLILNYWWYYLLVKITIRGVDKSSEPEPDKKEITKAMKAE